MRQPYPQVKTSLESLVFSKFVICSMPGTNRGRNVVDATLLSCDWFPHSLRGHL